ncbi:unnamed protein product [Fusarium equiseti]|uniref:Uncharacterized protein n=1 Tax=Fusarium equiseti TaxID=61235 RepID=A0A8J2IQW2_FUSEQ|nr:unnamed protein product [Fusarium equiseti]
MTGASFAAGSASGITIVPGTDSGSGISVDCGRPAISGRYIVSGRPVMSGIYIVSGISNESDIFIDSGISIVSNMPIISGISIISGRSVVSGSCSRKWVISGKWVVVGIWTVTGISVIPGTSSGSGIVGRGISGSGSSSDIGDDTNGPVSTEFVEVAIRALGVGGSGEWVVSGNEGISDISLITDSALSGIGIGDPIKSLGSARFGSTEFVDVAIRALDVDRSGNSVGIRDPLDDPACEVDFDVVGFATAVGSCLVLLTCFNRLCSPSIVPSEEEDYWGLNSLMTLLTSR